MLLCSEHFMMVCTSVRLLHSKLTIKCLFLECYPFFVVSCQLIYHVKCFIAVWILIFFLYFQHCGFQDHIFNTSIIFVHFLSSYPEICTALSTIFNLSFKFYCCKTKLLRTVSLFTTVLEFLNSCSCDAMTNLACFTFFFFNFILCLTQLICCLFSTVTPSYIQKKISTVVYLTLLIEQMVMSQFLDLRSVYCNTFKGRCCSKCCCQF